MKNYTYHFEIQSLVAQFMAALDDIVIKRYDKNRNARNDIKVRFLYSPKQRVIADLTDQAQNLQLPVVAISLGSIVRDAGRVYNKLSGSSFNKPNIGDKSVDGFLPQPLPVDITVNVDILTKYQEDMDQIISNFIPYCDPYFVISWRIPEMNNYEVRSVVNWSGSVSIVYPTDLNATTNFRVAGNTTFVIKGWMFKPIEDTPLIFNITENIHDLIAYYGIEQPPYAVVKVEGKPKLSEIIPNQITKRSSNKTILLKGDMFREVKAVYLSGSAIEEFTETYNPFFETKYLSATFPEFNAYKLDSANFTINSENLITITLPEVVQNGRLSVIVENLAGYQSLSGLSVSV